MNHFPFTSPLEPASANHIDWDALRRRTKDSVGEPSDARTRYVLVSSAPPVDPREIERAGTSVVEVQVLWRGDLMDVAHVCGPASYGLGRLPGEVESNGPRIEFSDGRAAVVLGSETNARIVSKDGKSGAVSTSAWIGLEHVERVDVDAGALTYRIFVTAAGKKSPRALGERSDRHVPLFFAGAAILGGALIGALAFYTPPLGLTDDEQPDRERIYLLRQYLHTNAERERVPEDGPSSDGPSNGGAAEVAASGREGALGRAEPSPAKGRLAVAADLASPSPALSHDAALELARNFGMIGLLSSGAPSADSSLAEFAAGADSQNSVGDLWSDAIGDRAGSGIALSDLGTGGGYIGDKIGLGRIGTCDGSERCAGTGTFGHFAGRTGPGHIARAPQIRTPGSVDVSGRLPATIIQRVVRQNFGRFRFCYETGLRENPNLAGRVTARFVIARDGSVATVQSGGSDLPDASVVQCVLQAYQGLSFPPPEDGIVTVSYPISFSPAA